MRWRLQCAIVLLVGLLPAFGQHYFGGVGISGWLPAGELSDALHSGIGGSMVLGGRQYCQLWVLFGLHHYRLRMKDTNAIRQRPLPPTYQELSAVDAAVRLFPWEPVVLPFYLQGNLLFSAIGAQGDIASPLGAGTAVGAGVVFPYSSPCCRWFLELHAQYSLWNVLLRDALRPIARSWSVGLHLRLGL
jgi:hypothetical protein